jgi:hypothetical protein
VAGDAIWDKGVLKETDSVKIGITETIRIPKAPLWHTVHIFPREAHSLVWRREAYIIADIWSLLAFR